MNDRVRAWPWDRIAVAGVAAAVILTLLLSVFFIFPATPIADDFWRALRPAQRGWWRYMWEDMYLKWTGRWSGIGLASAVHPRVDLLRDYAILLSLLYLVHVAAAYAFCRMLLRETASRRACLLLGLALWAIIWAGLPAPGETVYWISGGIDYQLSTSLAVIFLAWLTSPSAAAGWRTTARTLGLCALALVATGMHEMIAAMLVVVVGIGTAIAWKARHPQRIVWTVVCLATLIGALIAILAPGNAVRGTRFENGGNLVAAIRITIIVFLKHVPAWACDPKLLAASVALLAWPRHMALRPRWLELGARIPGGWAPLWLLTLPVILCLAIAGSAWGMGAQPNGRALDQLWTVFVFGWFTGVFAISRELVPQEHWCTAEGGRMLRAFACVVLAVALVFTGNTRRGLDDLQDGLIGPWRRAYFAWSAAAREAHERGETDLVVKPRPVVPRLYYSASDPTTDPTHFANRFFAEYHGLKTIRVERPSPGTREYADDIARRGWRPWLMVD